VVSIKIMVETVNQTISVRFPGNLAELQECEQVWVGLESEVLISTPP
jgi:transcriptional regulator with GAF, ATPase, and Fis domain